MAHRVFHSLRVLRSNSGPSQMKKARILIRLGGALLSLVLAVVLPGAGRAEPQRIVSINVCTDQLLLLLASPEKIASLSFLATDKDTSAMVETAAGFPINHGLAEEILRIEPDLVLAWEYTARSTVSILRKLDYPVVELPAATSLDDIRANIRTVAKAVGEIERGEALVAAFDKRLPPIGSAPPDTFSPVAALYWANGYSSGDDTLAGAVVKAAGFRNLAGELGIRGTAQIPLETLIASNPDIIITDDIHQTPALATEVFRHPALQAIFKDHRRVHIPSPLWACGTPVIADIIAELYAVRMEFSRLAHKDLGKP